MKLYLVIISLAFVIALMPSVQAGTGVSLFKGWNITKNDGFTATNFTINFTTTATNITFCMYASPPILLTNQQIQNLNITLKKRGNVQGKLNILSLSNVVYTGTGNNRKYVSACVSIAKDGSLADLIQFGDNTTIFELQNESKIEYFNDWANVNATLYKFQSGVYAPSVDSIYVFFNRDKWKFGANDTANTYFSSYKYFIVSSEPMVSEGYILRISKIDSSKISKTDTFDFSDICVRNKTALGYEFEPNCQFEYSNDMKTVNITFLSNSSIDPAVLSGSTINVWADNSRYEDNCSTLLTDVPSKVKSCVGKFAPTCIFVDASINITSGGPGNRTNFSISNCELRMNESTDGVNTITSWGNLTIYKSNITTNSSSKHYSINVKPDSNFSISNSRLDYLGWNDAIGQRGLEISSPVFIFNNFTSLLGGFSPIYMYSGSNGSVITNVTIDSTSGSAFVIENSHNMSLSNLSITNVGFRFLWLTNTHNSTVRSFYEQNGGQIDASGNYNVLDNITADSMNRVLTISGNNSIVKDSFGIGGGVCFIISGVNNTVDRIYGSSCAYGIEADHAFNSTFKNSLVTQQAAGLYVTASENNLFINISANGNSGDGINLIGLSHNNTFTNFTANNNGQYGIDISSQPNNNNTFSNFTANNNVIGVYIQDTNGRYNKFENFSIMGCTTTSSGCIFIGQNNANNSFIKGTVNNTQKYLVDIRNTNNTLFQDVQFINVTAINGAINITSTNANLKSFFNYFINCTFSKVTEATSSNSQIIRQWYLDVYVNNSIAQPVIGANVTVINGTNVIYNYSLTNSTGWIMRLNVTQYQNTSGVVSGFANYTIQANITGLINASIRWAIGNGTSVYGTIFGDWQGNNTRLSLTLSMDSPRNITCWRNHFTNAIISCIDTTGSYVNYVTPDINTTGWLNSSKGLVTSNGFFLGNVNVTGNQTSNSFRVWLWQHNDSTSGWEVKLPVQGVWYNVTGYNNSGDSGNSKNGFNILAIGQIKSEQSGIYQTEYSVSFERYSGGAAREYKFVMAVNGVWMNGTECHGSTPNVNSAQQCSSQGQLSININDVITLMATNLGGTESLGLHASSITMNRISTI